MGNRRLTLFLVCISSLFLIPACSTTEENTGSSDPVRASTYQEIVAAGQDVPRNFEDIKDKVEQFLEEEPETEDEQRERMIVAVIGAAAYYWANDTTRALELAREAYTCAPNHVIEFLPDWQAHQWLEVNDPKTARRLVQTKDFIISCANYGLPEFNEADDALVDEYNFSKAADLYHRAIYKGLEDKGVRNSCYLRWASSLYKLGDKQRAEEIFIERWMLDPKIEMHFAEPATLDYLKGLDQKYREKYPEIIQEATLP